MTMFALVDFEFGAVAMFAHGCRCPGVLDRFKSQFIGTR